MDRQGLISDAQDWAKQFLVCVGPQRAVRSERVLNLGDVEIHHFDGLKSTPLLDQQGQCVGIFLGHVIDYQNRRACENELRIDLEGILDQQKREQAVEDLVYAFGGRWVFVYCDGPARRIYLDADGSNSLVYDPEAGLAASTTGLLLDDEAYRERFDGELHRRLDVPRAGWFPSTLTAHRGIHRLLCNHFLDLSKWTAQRHWPRDDLRWTSDTKAHALRIAEIARNTAEPLVRSYSSVFALTGGNETRFLLAAYRPLVQDLEFVTVAIPGTELDVHHAKQLATRFGLRHRCLGARRASLAEAQAWQYGAGHCVGGLNMHYHPSIQPLSSYDYFVGGLGGEIGRAFFWRKGDSEAMRLDASSIVPRFGMPMHERVVEATREWFRSVEEFNPITQLDLAYLELRMSAWAFAQSYVQDAIVEHVHPLICREAFQLMLELPPDAKRDNRFITEGIAELWPELMELPINRYGDFRDRLALLRNLADPSRVARKLRKLFG